MFRGIGGWCSPCYRAIPKDKGLYGYCHDGVRTSLDWMKPTPGLPRRASLQRRLVALGKQVDAGGGRGQNAASWRFCALRLSRCSPDYTNEPN